jgi:hypothetical protein
MTNNERMALWATFNAIARSRGGAELDYGEARAWWDRYQSELAMERAHARCVAEGRVWE